MIIIDESINDAMRERVLADDLKADVETMIRRLCLCCKRTSPHHNQLDGTQHHDSDTIRILS
jgi:hypothetical protein